MRNLLRVADLAPSQLGALLELATQAKEVPHRFGHVLAGDTVALHGTDVAVATAVARAGGVPVELGPEAFGEPIEDAARAVSRWARAIVIRAAADTDLRRFAAASTVPVVNAGNRRHEPVQAIAALLTLEERFGRLHGLKVAYVGDGAAVAHSLVEACALAGVDVAVATPPGYEPDPAVMAAASELARRTGAGVLETHDPLVAVADADAVCTAAWPSTAGAFAGYQVDIGMMLFAARHAVFLHGLPAHRGEEVAASVIDGPRSLVFDVAENRLHVAVAVLVAVAGAGDVLGLDEGQQDALTGRS